jgi:hypothetical protein
MQQTELPPTIKPSILPTLNDAANGENEGKWHRTSLQGLQLRLLKDPQSTWE